MRENTTYWGHVSQVHSPIIKYPIVGKIPYLERITDSYIDMILNLISSSANIEESLAKLIYCIK